MANPQINEVTNPQPLWRVNSKWVNGIAPGYAPTAGAGLVLNLSAGACLGAAAIHSYAGGTLALTDNSTNYVFLDPTSSFAPNSNTTGFADGLVPIATVVTASGAITSIVDNRLSPQVGAASQICVQQETYIYAADTGAANAYAVALTPAPTLVAGSIVVFKAANANSGASTLAVNGGAAKAIKKNGAIALSAGDIPSGQIVMVVYDGTNFQLVGVLVSPVQIEQNAFTYSADTGAANAYAVTLAPVPTVVAGSMVIFKAANANSGASTLAVNGAGAVAIKKQGATALSSGDIALNQIVVVIYDGTNFQMLGAGGGGGGSATLAGLTDVLVSSPADRNILIYHSSDSKWHNDVLVAGDIPSLPASKITSGQLALARGGTGVDLSASGGTTKILAQDASHVVSARDLLAADVPNIAESQVTSLVSDLALKAPLASPALTGTPTAPTAAVDTNTTQIADTAFVIGQAAAATPLVESGSGAVGTSTRFARGDHVHPAAAAAGLVIGFIINNGAVGNNVGPELAAPRAATVSKCVIVTKTSDGTTALTFRIKMNGVDVFSVDPTVAAGTVGGTVSSTSSLTSSPLSVSASDVFTIDITSGSPNWSFSAQLET